VPTICTSWKHTINNRKNPPVHSTYVLWNEVSVPLPCYVAFNVLSLALKTVVGQQGYKFYHSVILSPVWVTWRHWSRDHKIHSRWFPIGGPLTPTPISQGFRDIKPQTFGASWPWPFWGSRDASISISHCYWDIMRHLLNKHTLRCKCIGHSFSKSFWEHNGLFYFQ